MTMHTQISVLRCGAGVLGTVVLCAVIRCVGCDDGGGSDAEGARTGNSRLSTLAPIMNSGRPFGGYAKSYNGQYTSKEGRDLCVPQNGPCTE
jgi:hypothetical protein